MGFACEEWLAAATKILEGEAKFSLPYCVAVALKHHKVGLVHFGGVNLEDEGIRELMSKIRLTVSAGLDSVYPQTWPAVAEIETESGRLLSKRIDFPTRDPENPLSKEEVGAKANEPARQAMKLHLFYKGKIQIVSKCAIRDSSGFSVWYTPGVAAPCLAIQDDPELVWEHRNKSNCIAVASDGTRVLGLGDIDPEAGLPVMEGKALLFKYLGGLDAVPICLVTKDPEEFIRTVKLMEPSFGGINLEDISQPKCFRILNTLRAQMDIPLWHDEQQGTATVLLAGLLNALRIVGKEIDKTKIAVVGMGAANVATYRLLKPSGVELEGIVACDSKGTLHRGRQDIEQHEDEFDYKWRVCNQTNPEGIVGGIPEAVRGADVCIAFSDRVQAPSTQRGQGNGQGCRDLPLPQPHPGDIALGGY